MSRRSFPQIEHAALRDHADEARIDRVWERVEHDLVSRAQGEGVGRSRRVSLAYVAIAATLGAFGAGLWIGKAMWDRRPALVEAPIAAPVTDKSRVEVLAAGTQLRTFPLEGGGRLTLSPGATMEVERSGSALTLSLLQGKASIDTAGVPRSGLSVVAGDARLNTKEGSVISVTRNADQLDVRVDNGSVSITAPGGTQQQLSKDEQTQVPLHAAVTSNNHHTTVKPQRNGAPAARRTPAPNPMLPKGVAVPEWLARYSANDHDGAFALLQKQDTNLAIESAKSAAELSAIGDLMRGKGRNPPAAMRAYQRIVQSFPSDAQAAYAAAVQIATMYENAGQPDKGKEYRAVANKLALNTGQAADALFCNSVKDQMRADPDKSHAVALAKEYLDKYPDGACHVEFEQQLSPPPSDAPAGSGDPAPAPAPTAP